VNSVTSLLAYVGYANIYSAITRQNFFVKLSVHMLPVAVAQSFSVVEISLSTSGFMDDVTFSYNGPHYGVVTLSQQPRCRVPAAE